MSASQPVFSPYSFISRFCGHSCRSANVILNPRSPVSAPAISASSQANKSMSSRPIPRQAGEFSDPRPSASVILLSPTNEVLLLHRVHTSSSFASAHVFPGGNLDPRHDGDIPGIDSPDRHRDGPAYKIAAVRECFEECGILLARPTPTSSTITNSFSNSSSNRNLIHLSASARDRKRKEIHSHKTKFMDFLAELDAVPDINGLLPFTRWITPANIQNRYSTQMYLYLLPISTSFEEDVNILPSPDGDGGVEHTAATFAPAGVWLEMETKGEIKLMPPQAYLLHLIHRVFNGPFEGLPYTTPAVDVRDQRKRLVEWLVRTPTAERSSGDEGAMVAWADKVISPVVFFRRKSDGRMVLVLDAPVRGLDRRWGDPDRVVLARFVRGAVSEVEVRMREAVVKEENEDREGGLGRCKM